MLHCPSARLAPRVMRSGFHDDAKTHDAPRQHRWRASRLPGAALKICAPRKGEGRAKRRLPTSKREEAKLDNQGNSSILKRRRLRIAQLAPLYERVPPQLYGGTERMVSFITEEWCAAATKLLCSLPATREPALGSCRAAMRLCVCRENPNLPHHCSWRCSPKFTKRGARALTLFIPISTTGLFHSRA